MKMNVTYSDDGCVWNNIYTYIPDVITMTKSSKFHIIRPMRSDKLKSHHSLCNNYYIGVVFQRCTLQFSAKINLKAQ